MEPIDSFEYKGYDISFFPDESVLNPREFNENANVFAFFHKRYILGDKVEYKESDFDSWNEMYEQIEADGGLFITPIYMLDHSQQWISDLPFSCRWDSGQIGFMYSTQELMEAHDLDEEACKERMKKDLSFYDLYLRGEFYVADVCRHGIPVLSIDYIDDNFMTDCNRENVMKYIDQYEKILMENFHAELEVEITTAEKRLEELKGYR